MAAHLSLIGDKLLNCIQNPSPSSRRPLDVASRKIEMRYFGGDWPFCSALWGGGGLRDVLRRDEGVPGSFQGDFDSREENRTGYLWESLVTTWARERFNGQMNPFMAFQSWIWLKHCARWPHLKGLSWLLTSIPLPNEPPGLCRSTAALYRESYEVCTMNYVIWNIWIG